MARRFHRTQEQKSLRAIHREPMNRNEWLRKAYDFDKASVDWRARKERVRTIFDERRHAAKNDPEKHLPLEFFQEYRLFPIGPRFMDVVVNEVDNRLYVDPALHPHLPVDDTGQVHVERGDLRAAAPWAIFYDPSGNEHPRPGKNRTRFYRLRNMPEVVHRDALIEEMENRELMRRLSIQKAIRGGTDMIDRGKITDLRELVPARASEYEYVPSELKEGKAAERFLQSMLSRLGDLLTPGFTARHANAELDHFGVDLVVSIDKNKFGLGHFGLSITTHTSPEHQERERRYMKRNVVQRVLHQNDLQLAGVVLAGNAYFLNTLSFWQKQRGDTALTPDQFLPDKKIIQLAQAALHVIRYPDGNNVYTDMDIEAAVKEVYGHLPESYTRLPY